MSDDTQETMTVDAEFAEAFAKRYLTLPNRAQEASIAKLCEQHITLAAEVRRLRKLFDDAGQGEHSVLALMALRAEVRRLREENAKLLADRDMHAKHVAGTAKLLDEARAERDELRARLDGLSK